MAGREEKRPGKSSAAAGKTATTPAGTAPASGGSEQAGAVEGRGRYSRPQRTVLASSAARTGSRAAAPAPNSAGQPQGPHQPQSGDAAEASGSNAAGAAMSTLPPKKRGLPPIRPSTAGAVPEKRPRAPPAAAAGGAVAAAGGAAAAAAEAGPAGPAPGFDLDLCEDCARRWKCRTCLCNRCYYERRQCRDRAQRDKNEDRPAVPCVGLCEDCFMPAVREEHLCINCYNDQKRCSTCRNRRPHG